MKSSPALIAILTVITLLVVSATFAILHAAPPRDGKPGPKALTIEQTTAHIVELARNGVLVRTRPTWPEHYEIRACIADLTFLHTEARMVLQITTRNGDLLRQSWVTGAIAKPRLPGVDLTFAIPRSCWNGEALELAYRLVSPNAADAPAGDEFRQIFPNDRAEVFAVGEISIPFRIVKSVTEVLTPITDTAFTDMLARETKVDLVELNARYTVRIDWPDHRFDPNQSIASEFIFLCDNRVIGIASGWCDELCHRTVVASNLFLSVELDNEAMASGKPVSVLIRGSLEYALRDFDQETYWAGGFMLPVEVFPATKPQAESKR